MSGSNAICVSTVLRDNRHAHDGADPVQAGRAQRGDRSCGRMRGREMPLQHLPQRTRLRRSGRSALQRRASYQTGKDGNGTIPIEIAYGGTFFGIVEAKALVLRCGDEARDLAVRVRPARHHDRRQSVVN
ncbi:hypothetical protein GHK48_14015 [Sinorhizobium fredii]|uniref:Uncharacterized protein n=2 Tax=Rhizobium fredii TaxID=380 RepID=A0A844ACI7_RHIFR|nr:hypothetical protein [Sinorhizobium fredii]